MRAFLQITPIVLVATTLLTGCSNEESLAIAASSGKFTPAELHDAAVSVRTSEQWQKATSAEEKAAIMSRYHCELSYERRRRMWLGNLGPTSAEYAAYMRSDPIAREQYWKQVSQKTGCTF